MGQDRDAWRSWHKAVPMMPSLLRYLKFVVIGTPVALLALNHGQPARYKPIPFPPVDHAVSDPELTRFRQDALSAARRRAVDELTSLASQETKVDGEVFASRLRRDLTETVSPPWEAFIGALSLGGSFTTARGAVKGRREFCAPYVYSEFPEILPPWIGGENVPWVIVKAGTPVYRSSRTSSPVIARVGNAIVEFLDAMPPEASTPKDRGWVLIALSSTTRGWVTDDVVKSPDDWHVCLARETGRWRVSLFSRDGFKWP